MDKSVVVALISGTFSTFSALGAVFLKDWLEARRQKRAQAKSAEAAPAPASESPVPSRSQTRSRPAPPASPRPAASAEPTESVAVVPSSSRMRPVIIVVGSVVFGMVSRAVRPLFPMQQVHYDAIIALGVMVGFTLWLATDHRRRGGVVGFELENLALWSGWTCGWLLVHGQIWGDLLSVGIMWWFGCAVVGAAIVAIRGRSGGLASSG